MRKAANGSTAALMVLPCLAWRLQQVAIKMIAGQTLFYQLVGACALLLPIALVTGQAVFRPTPLAWASLGFQAIVACFAANLMWFWLLRKYFAAQAFSVGAVLVLVGIVLVNGRGARPTVSSATSSKRICESD